IARTGLMQDVEGQAAIARNVGDSLVRDTRRSGDERAWTAVEGPPLPAVLRVAERVLAIGREAHTVNRGGRVRGLSHELPCPHLPERNEPLPIKPERFAAPGETAVVRSGQACYRSRTRLSLKVPHERAQRIHPDEMPTVGRDEEVRDPVICFAFQDALF